MHNGAVGSPAVDLFKIAMLCLDSKKILEFALERRERGFLNVVLLNLIENFL